MGGERLNTNNSSEETIIIRDLSFSFEAGQKIAVIGTVGSGKTSFLMSILGEMPVSQGRILIK